MVFVINFFHLLKQLFQRQIQLGKIKPEEKKNI